MSKIRTLSLLLISLPLLSGGFALSAEVRVGAATADITPDRPVALAGQFELRVSQKVETPLQASALAIESWEGGRAVDQALFLSVDLVGIGESILAKFRGRLATVLPEVDARKVILSATHTHTAPVTTEVQEEAVINYPIPKEGVMHPAEYVDFLIGRLAEAAKAAWTARKAAGVSWTLGFAAVGENRRATYADGSAIMYGPTARADFRSMEAGSDAGVESLFFWDAEKNLIAVAVNLACPSQEMESSSNINADFWHDARLQLREKLRRPGLPIVGWCSAAGDQSPHPQYRKAAEERMAKLRGLTRQQELGRRLAHAVADTAEAAMKDIRTDVPFVHRIETLPLPARRISEREFREARQAVESYREIAPGDNHASTMLLLQQSVVQRYELGEKQPPYPVEMHVVRLGDVALATNPFELYLDYGIQIKGGSPTAQTFLIQLANGSGIYLPTQRAINGGSYSALPYVNKVGPDGGQKLVEATLAAIRQLFPAPAAAGQ